MGWALSWMTLAYLAGDYAAGWATMDGRPVKRVAVAFMVVVACFAVPVVAGILTNACIPPVLIMYDPL